MVAMLSWTLQPAETETLFGALMRETVVVGGQLNTAVMGLTEWAELGEGNNTLAGAVAGIPLGTTVTVTFVDKQMLDFMHNWVRGVTVRALDIAAASPAPPSCPPPALTRRMCIPRCSTAGKRASNRWW